MLYNISDETVRSWLEALVQLHREGDVDALLSFVSALEEAADKPYGELLLSAAAQIGKMPIQKRD